MENDPDINPRMRKSFLVEAYEKHLYYVTGDTRYEDDFFVYQPDDIEVMNQVDKMLKLCIAAAGAVPLFVSAAAYTLLGFRSR